MLNRFEIAIYSFLFSILLFLSGCLEQKKSVELVYELPAENSSIEFINLQVEEREEQIKIQYELLEKGEGSGLFFRSHKDYYFLSSTYLGNGQCEALLNKLLLKSGVYEIGICPGTDIPEVTFSNYYFGVIPNAQKFKITRADQLLYSIEKFVVDSSKIQIQGWAYIKGQSMIFKSISVGLMQDSIGIFYDTELQDRKDVTSYFNPGYNVDQSGFHVTIPIKRLQKGIHKIVIKIIDLVDSTDYYSLTERDIILPMRLDSLPSETANLSYRIEDVSASEKSIQIRGWTYLHGMGSEGAEIYLLFKADVVYAIKLSVLERKDVTSYFHSKFNINRSGFNLVLERSLFMPKEYQLGVMIINEGEYGVAYTKNLVNMNL